MKLFSSLTVAILGAAMLAMPASAAVVADHPVVDTFELLSAPALKAEPAALVCEATFELEAAILFVEAQENCHPALADATGLCLSAMPIGTGGLNLSLSPDASLRCTSIRPSPPG